MENIKGFVYILISQKDGNRYIGSTSDLKRRLKEHNDGSVISTKNRRPFKLFAYQTLDDIVEARLLERKYKKSRGTTERAIKSGLFVIFGV